MTAGLDHVTSTALPFEVSAENLGAKCPYYTGGYCVKILAVFKTMLRKFLLMSLEENNLNKRGLCFIASFWCLCVPGGDQSTEIPE